MNYIKFQYKLVSLFIKEQLTKTFIKCFIGFWLLLFISAYYMRYSVGSDSLNEIIKELSANGSVISVSPVWYVHFIKFLESSMISILLGFIPFLAVAVVFLVLSAGLGGYSAAIVAVTKNTSVLLAFLTTMGPHGIVQNIFYCLSVTCGIYLCKEVTAKLRKREGADIKTAFMNCVRVFICVVVPGMFVASLLEAFLTPIIAGLL